MFQIFNQVFSSFSVFEKDEVESLVVQIESLKNLMYK